MDERARPPQRRSAPLQERGAPSFAAGMRAAFSMPLAPALEVRDLSFGPLAATELRYDADDYGQSAPIPHQDAIMVSWQLRTNPRHDVWEDGKLLPGAGAEQGTTCVFDLRRGVTARSAHPFHCVNFALPLRSLHEAGEERGLRLALDRTPRKGQRDPVVHALGMALLPALARPEQASRLFVDHVLFALRAHVAQRFGGALERAPAPGGLATWQARRAKALIEARLAENISLAEVARECGLSVAQFARAFKRSTGLPPHRYLIERRVQRARELLLHTGLPLADVAVRCGFADQSHFTKVFHRLAGTSPGTFRAAARTTRGVRS